jgi:hypothetical protein
MKSLMEEIQRQKKELTLQKASFFTHGIFFICLGVFFLIAAYLGLERGVHTSFSFVLVVLGVAILLFGTGTQGIGKLESDTATAKYNIAIAGGAGALAIAIGWGMTTLGSDIRRTFALETRYVAAELRPRADSNSSFASYWGHFEIDGQPIPSVHRGDFFFAYVPYVETQRHSVKRIRYKLLPIDQTKLDPNLKPVVADVFELPLKEVNLNNSSSDFPIYDKIPPIDMRNTSAVNAVLQAGGSRKFENAPGAAPPDPPPPAALESQ